MDKWECTVCGYIYDPAVGDPTTDVKPGTAFEDLPEAGPAQTVAHRRTTSSKSDRQCVRI